jgi:hypothetical protein
MKAPKSKKSTAYFLLNVFYLINIIIVTIQIIEKIKALNPRLKHEDE